MVGVKIKCYSIRQEGKRGTVIGLPKVWTDDTGLKPGDKIDIYRDSEDRLILVPVHAGKKRQTIASVSA